MDMDKEQHEYFKQSKLSRWLLSQIRPSFYPCQPQNSTAYAHHTRQSHHGSLESRPKKSPCFSRRFKLSQIQLIVAGVTSTSNNSLFFNPVLFSGAGIFLYAAFIL